MKRQRLVTAECCLLFALSFLVCHGPHLVAQERPDIYGIGLMWSDWWAPGELPPAYQSNPRSYDWAQMDLITGAGGNACHGTFDWINIEPTQGTYDWTRADERVADAVARGLTMYAYIGNTPDWACPPNGLPGYRTPPDATYEVEFMNYCTAVASRYAGQCDNFFFWNEPNGCSWINNGCSNMDGYPLYTYWLKRAYTALKAGNPACTVAAGVLDYNEGVTQGWRYIEGMYNEGAKDYFDAIAIHPYSLTGIHWQAILDTRAVMVAHGDAHKNIWINEWGWGDSWAPDAPQRLTDFLTEIKKPEYNYVTYCRYLVVSDLPSGQYGLCNHELTPRPIYSAYQGLDKTFPTPTYGPSPTPSPTLTATPTRVPGVILNPGFEEGLKGWRWWEHYPYDGDGGTVSYPGHMPMKWDITTNIPLSGPTHGGAHSSGSDLGYASGRGGMYQEVPVIPGQRYRVSFWGATGPTDDSLRLGWIDGTETWLPYYGIPGATEELDLIPELTDDWAQLSGEILPSTSPITLYADWRHDWATLIGSAWVDDWALEEVSEASSWSLY